MVRRILPELLWHQAQSCQPQWLLCQGCCQCSIFQWMLIPHHLMYILIEDDQTPKNYYKKLMKNKVILLKINLKLVPIYNKHIIPHLIRLNDMYDLKKWRALKMLVVTFYLSTFLGICNSTGELYSRFTFGLKIQLQQTKMVALGEEIAAFLAKIRVEWRSHFL